MSVGIPMHHELYLKQNGTPVVESADKNHPKGLFSTAIFGVTEEERTHKYALVNLQCYCMRPHILSIFKRVDRKWVSCLTSRTEHKIDKSGRLVPYMGEELLSGEAVGYGPMFLYDNWDKIDRNYLKQTVGRFNNKEMKMSIVNLSRDDFFTHYTYVIPIAYREEESDSMILVNEYNLFMSDIIRYSNLLKSQKEGLSLQARDIEVLLQDKLLEYCDYLIKRYLGPHGVARKGILSRSVANSSRTVAIPVTYKSSKLGKGKINMQGIGVPIHHLLNNFRDTVVKFSKDFIQYLYDHQCFDADVTQDYLSVYDVEFIQDRILKMEDPYQRLATFPAICADGSFRPLTLPISIRKDDKSQWTEEELHPLSWIEFFYIVVESFAQLYDRKFITGTRYPIDSTLSLQVLRPVTLTLNDRLTCPAKIFDFEYDDGYPYIGEDLKDRYQDKIFETSTKFAPHVIAPQNGDHDGDAESFKPINSDEAVAEAEKISNNLLNIFDWSGNFRRSVGRDCSQCWFTFTRDPKPKDNAQTIPSSHPFLQYLKNLENGQLDTEVLYKYTASFDPSKKPECGLYDSVTITVGNKKIHTTLGRYVFNKVSFYEIWDSPYFKFVNEAVFSDVLVDVFKYVSQLIIEKKVPQNTLRSMIDMSIEFGMRLSNIYNSGLTYDMLNPDKTFTAFRDKKLNEVRERVESGDLEAMASAEKEIIDYAKEYYKDDDMFEVYESKNTAKWDNDFKALNIAMGSLPKLTGGKPTVIFESLVDGIGPEHIPDLTNVGMVGSTNRAKQTALAGAQAKDLNYAMQSVMGKRGDCGTTKTVVVNTTDKFKLLNRYIVVGNKLVLITLDNVDSYLGKNVNMRDAIYCKEKNGHYCSTCLGEYIFKATGQSTVPLGMYVSDIPSAILNMFMKSTHSLKADMFRIKDIHEFIHPNITKPLFETRKDPNDGIEKIYCLDDIVWNVPLAAVDAVDTEYSVLAHGSIVTTSDGHQYTFVLGTEVHTSPTEIVNPNMEETPELERHIVFRYKKGDVFLNQVLTYRKEMTIYKMMNLFLSGNVSNLVPFETHLDTMRNAIITNKTVKINDVSLRIILSSLARDKRDPKKPARETGTTEYQFVSLYDLTILGGMFNAMFGPDALKGIFVNLTKSEAEQTKTPSPIEKALRY